MAISPSFSRSGIGQAQLQPNSFRAMVVKSARSGDRVLRRLIAALFDCNSGLAFDRSTFRTVWPAVTPSEVRLLRGALHASDGGDATSV